MPLSARLELVKSLTKPPNPNTELREEEIESEIEERSDDDHFNTRSDNDSDYEPSILLESPAA